MTLITWREKTSARLVLAVLLIVESMMWCDNAKPVTFRQPNANRCNPRKTSLVLYWVTIWFLCFARSYGKQQASFTADYSGGKRCKEGESSKVNRVNLLKWVRTENKCTCKGAWQVMSDRSLLIDRPLNLPRNKMTRTYGTIWSNILLTSQVFIVFRLFSRREN